MDCPRCLMPLQEDRWQVQAPPLDPYRAPAVSLSAELQRCPGCSGVWLPFDSVGARLAESLDGETARRLSALWKWDQTKLNVSDDLRLPCPACREPMTKLRSQANFMILYDGCRACAGIWLDAGELERLARALANTA